MKQENKVSPYIPWYLWFALSVVIGGIGFAMIANAYDVGWFFICLSCLFDILAFKALITEAIVEALEVFHGKKRAVQE